MTSASIVRASDEKELYYINLDVIPTIGSKLFIRNPHLGSPANWMKVVDLRFIVDLNATEAGGYDAESRVIVLVKPA